MVLVTGGTGLVGSHLLYHLLLKNNIQVRAIHTQSSDLNAVKKVFTYYSSNGESLFNKIRWVEADLNTIPALELAFQDITQVYHCAAMISFSSREYQKMRRVNIEGTTNIVNLCISNHIKKLCFVSSIAAIENGNEGELVNESDNWTNTSDKSGYSITKYGAEMEVWRGSQEGIDVIIVNPGVILGSGFWHKGTGTMFRRINNGLKFYTEGITGFVGVKDVVQAMILLMSSEVTNQRFILVSENLSFRKVLSLIAASLNKETPKIKINKFMSELLWRFEFLRSGITLSAPLLTKYTARSSVSNHPYTSEKIENTLGFEFTKISDCINNTAAHFNKRMN
jgi:nucleoside-diphosphate-sugar epimerase